MARGPHFALTPWRRYRFTYLHRRHGRFESHRVHAFKNERAAMVEAAKQVREEVDVEVSQVWPTPKY